MSEHTCKTDREMLDELAGIIPEVPIDDDLDWELEPGFVLLSDPARSPGALAFSATVVAAGMDATQSYKPGDRVLVISRPDSIWLYSDRMLVTFMDQIVGSKRREPKQKPKLLDMPQTQTGADQS